MFVRMWMTTDVVTVAPETPIMEAQNLMKEKGIRRLPVVDKRGRLVGIITQGDIQEASPSDATSLSIWELNYLLARTRVAEVMTKREELLSISPDEPIEQAASLMRQHKVGGLPVLKGEKLVGIITESDLFDAMSKLLGIDRGGTRLTLELEDEPGALAAVLNVIKQHQSNVLSVVTCEECRSSAERGVVVIRIADYDFREIVHDLHQHGITVLDARS